jgi:Ca2+-binding RTX toxin-like protein
VVVAGSVAAALLLMTIGVSAEAGPATAVSPAEPGVVPDVVVTMPATPIFDSAPPARVLGLPSEETFAGTTTLLVSAAIAEDGRYVGTAAADSVTGTAADESFKGYAGADTIGGGPGRDTIDGGDGADTIRGGDGADTLNGGRGRDTIGGGAGADTINGGAGADIIQGGAGRDTVAAGAGDDIVRVWADGTPDTVDCGGGNDRAIIGSSDTATGCETVVVRDPA